VGYIWPPAVAAPQHLEVRVSGVTTSNPIVAMEMLWRSKTKVAIQLAGHRRRIDKPAHPHFRDSKWLVVHSHGTEKLRRGMCDSISPLVLHQREADRSISLRYPGCAGLVNAQKILAAHHSCCCFELTKVSLTKGLLGISKPRHLCTSNTKQFLLKYPSQSLSPQRVAAGGGSADWAALHDKPATF